MVAKDDAPDLTDKALDLVERVFKLVWSSDNTQDAWHWIILIFVVLVVAGVVLIAAFKALGGALEHLVKFIEVYKSSGFPMWLNTTNKSRVRRRKQFCAVLDADLAYLAKAENWNDLYFTDLEAEVETEGGYYASAWDSLRRKKSFGLRKERSLIRAITSSAERAMQLVGEPGSGKSVALRHLAKQFAEQGRKSNDKNATVPLYINLREMGGGNIDTLSANSVREFVLDNIRRGDADTSAFVKENWVDYCDRGIWLFLFDSFDEIPAVLHSEAGSNVIRHYSQAIRQFLEGMGECKGILASREFKGPEALPWKKLRILPLSGEKQDELIQNSFLDTRHMGLVRQHLARSHSSIGSTPLFLTLLCRYVRDEHQTPKNDHDILLQHIERLARREPEYLLRKYKLTPDQLIIGAERLARLFAEDETLSLAPSLDQIIAQLPPDQIPEGSIERLISALVDCKIGRADVPNAAQGDRRFAFAHRRYQEALFVRYLARYPEALSAQDLLTEPRWREYTVTLLQTRNTGEISGLLNAARLILEDRASQQNSKSSTHTPLPSNLAYFDWNSEIAVPLLSLLQEGLARRLQDVPEYLSLAILAFLRPRWQGGDTWDRCEVLRLGGLLPHDTLVECLVEVFSSGTKAERLQAFKQAAFTSGLPDIARSAVLKMLSDQVILAENRADQLTLEALAARLPISMGASFVVSRGNRLRRNLVWMKKVLSAIYVIVPVKMAQKVAEKLIRSILSDVELIIDDSGKQLSDSTRSIPMFFDLFAPFAFLLSIWVMCLAILINDPSKMIMWLFFLMSLMVSGYVAMFSPFIVRDHGRKITFNDVVTWASSFFISRKFFVFVALLLLVGSSFVMVAAALGYAVDWFAREYLAMKMFDVEVPGFGSRIGVGMASIMTLSYLIMIPLMVVSSRKATLQGKNSLEELDRIRSKVDSDIAVIYSAKNGNQLMFWLQADGDLLSEVHSIRTFSSFVMKIIRMEMNLAVRPVMELPDCLKNGRSNKSSVKIDMKKMSTVYRVRQMLEDRLVKTLVK